MRGVTAAFCEHRYGKALREIRAALHRQPEPSQREYRTTALIRGELERLGAELLPLPLETGVAALLRGKRAGAAVALRADIDALPIQEETHAPDASETPGMMHACGHDVHTAGLLGAAMLLKERQDELRGNVLLLFQPAEENLAGAREILNTGVFERLNVAATFGLHVWPDMALGQVGLCEGVVTAAKDSFRIVVHGVGGHGASPQMGRDPIVAGSAIVCAMQSVVSRNLSPLAPAVLSICQVHAGTCDNVIPDTYTMVGSMRTFSAGVRSSMLQPMERLTVSMAEAYGCSASFEVMPGVPAQYNAPALAGIARQSVTEALGAQAACEEAAAMISEDFALYPAPSYFYRLGVRGAGEPAEGLHSPRFYADARALAQAAALLANSALGVCGAEDGQNAGRP